MQILTIMVALRVRHNTGSNTWGRLVRSGLVLSAMLLAGCSDSSSVPTSTDNAFYWKLQLNQHALNLAVTAPANTAQLVATPLSAKSAALSDTGTVQYSAHDSAVTVSSTGLVTAHFRTDGALVIAKFTARGTTHADTAIVRVTDTPLAEPLATLSIQPQAGGLDGAMLSVDGYERFSMFATTTSGDTVCSAGIDCPLLVRFEASDPNLVQLESNFVLYPLHVGDVTLYASAFAYGVNLRDSLRLHIGYATGASWNQFSVHSFAQRNTVSLYLPLSKLVIGVGGSVSIWNFAGQTIEARVPLRTHTVIDTLPPSDSAHYSIAVVQFDSVGTYTVSLRALPAGETIMGTVMVSEGP